MKNQDIVIVFHKSSEHTFCDDGFAAAFAAWLVFKEKALYLPAIHGKPYYDLSIFKGKTVFFLDYAYSIDEMDLIESVAKSLNVLDHHQNVLEAAGNREAFSHSSVLHSGAVLSWKYFHPTTTIPLMLEHIEDNDLGQHGLPHTKAFIQRLRIEPYQFEHWQALKTILSDEKQDGYQHFIQEGGLLQKQNEIQAQALMDEAIKVCLAGIEGMAVNATRYQTAELAPLLAEKSGTFGAIFTIQADATMDVSLRSLKGGTDVSKMAEHYGGGGHPNAAGFRTKNLSLFLK